MTASRLRRGARAGRAVACAMLLGAAPHALHAQAVAGPASPQRAAGRAGSLLIGSVLVADSASTPIAGAEVVLQELGLRTLTDEIGNYTLANVPKGTHLVLVRYWGFAMSRARLTFSGSDTVAHLVGLSPIMLSAVTVRAPAPRDPRDADLESRKARAAMAGHLVDRVVLDRLPGRRLGSAITRAPGVRLVLVNGKYVAASTRGAISVSARRECLMKVYVDGLPVTATRGAPVSVDDYLTEDVEAVEIYSSAARVPLEYGGTGAACGVIAIWRRNGR